MARIPADFFVVMYQAIAVGHGGAQAPRLLLLSLLLSTKCQNLWSTLL
jgi:hypothetical protein